MALVLVTGGSGFIGHHLVEALRAHGQRVRVLDVRAPATANAADVCARVGREAARAGV